MLFTFAFTVELILNIFANWLERFIGSGWNWFDVLIVGISLVDFGVSNIPDWLVKLMRAFRVIRLFGRVKELKTMVTAVTASIIPMMNAFVILLIVLGICESARRTRARTLARRTRARTHTKTRALAKNLCHRTSVIFAGGSAKNLCRRSCSFRICSNRIPLLSFCFLSLDRITFASQLSHSNRPHHSSEKSKFKSNTTSCSAKIAPSRPVRVYQAVNAESAPLGC